MFGLRVQEVESVAVLVCISVEVMIVKDKIEWLSVSCWYCCLESCCAEVKNRQERGYPYIHKQLAAEPSGLPPTLG